MRTRRRHALAAVALAAAVVVVVGVPILIRSTHRAVTSPAIPPSSAGSTSAPDDRLPAGYRGPLLSVRTYPDDKGLVASYIGGACDNPAHLAVAESAVRIDVGVVFAGPTVARPCPAIGIRRFVSIRLTTPISGRSIYSGGRQIIPFDGLRLLTPTYLPAGFSMRLEEGSEDVDSASAPAQPASIGSSPAPSSVLGMEVITEWTRSYSAPEKPNTGDHCTPGRGSITIAQSPVGSNQVSDEWKFVGIEQVGSASARVLRQTYPGIDGWLITWPAAGGTVSVTAETDCSGDHIPDLAEVLKVARSLH